MKRLQTLFLAWVFPWVPKRLLSRTTGVLMRIPYPLFIARPLVKAFAGLFGINRDEAELCDYYSLDAYFTRRLRPDLRPVQGEFVHPVDGKLTEQGDIRSGELIQAKGWTYSLSEFLGSDELARAYEGGKFLTYYLCPADYHRVHSPAAGSLVSARHIPGLLWPVNEWSVHNVRRLFNLNERVVLNFLTPRGRWSLVMVGATNVGHMTITLDPSITTNRWMWHAPTGREYMPPLPVKSGEELGMFHLGSTVICVFEKSLGVRVPGRILPVKMGERVF